ncbi:MAG: hypothetical protein R3Y23_05525 [Bacillota bacterium]
MKLFDDIITKVEDLLADKNGKSYEFSQKKLAISTKKNELVLGSESAYELGSAQNSCVNFVAVTMDETLVPRDEVVVYGKDLQDIKGDCNFARITIVRTDDIYAHGEQHAYNIFKDIELSKFNVSIDGYMMRSSGFSGREQVRVSKKIIKKGIDFCGVGNRFINQYKQNKHVACVKIIFITLDECDYDALEVISIDSNKRMKALNHMLADLKMDCKSCEWKPVCDEVDGMKEAHVAMLK